jgi:hypothetical protein
MSIRWVETPRTLTQFDPPTPLAPAEAVPDNELGLDAEQVEHVAEIFKTPLTGSYNWDYRVQDDRIRKLYELGKQLNWNASTDIDWSQSPDFHQRPPVGAEQRKALDENRANALFKGFAPWEAMDTDQVIQWMRHQHSWAISQFLHGEQGALLVASQLVSCATSFNA